MLLKMHSVRMKAVILLCYALTCVSGKRRDYFIRIEEVSWNYAPTGMNLIHNRSLQNDE